MYKYLTGWMKSKSRQHKLELFVDRVASIEATDEVLKSLKQQAIELQDLRVVPDGQAEDSKS